MMMSFLTEFPVVSSKYMVFMYTHYLRTLNTVSTLIYNTRWQEDYFWHTRDYVYIYMPKKEKKIYIYVKKYIYFFFS